MAEDIAQWLGSLGLGRYAQAFAENGNLPDFDRLRGAARVCLWLRSEVPDYPIEVRSSPNIRHSLANVGFRGV